MTRGKLDPREVKERRERQDAEWLMRQPQFRRFLLLVIQQSKILDRAPTDGSQGAVHADMARRNLGLAILDMVERGQPKPHPDGMPIFTLIQTLLEEANPQPSEGTDDDEGNDEQRYDRNAELNLAD